MYPCKLCGTHNPLDSSFCKKCGGPLPEGELVEARAKLDHVIEEGHNLFTEGRTEEAMMIAESAVLSNPSSHLALSLKGLCYERQGQVAEALECYEGAVALNPDGTLDKIKVTALRNRLAQHTETVPPNRQRAAMQALAAVGLVVAVGSLVAFSFASRNNPKQVALAPNEQVAVFPAASPDVQVPVKQGTEPSAPQTPSTPAAESNPTAISQPAPDSRVYLPSANGAEALPPAGGSGLTGPLVVEPEQKPAQRIANHTIDPPPTVVDTTAPPEPPKALDRGLIDIQVSHPHPTNPNQPGAQSVDNANGLGLLAKTARSQYQLGKFGPAAATYEKLVQMGGNSPAVQQRLGQCYEKTGNKAGAIAAFNQAITGFQSSIKAGRNVEANKAGLDSCLQALQVLGG